MPVVVAGDCTTSLGVLAGLQRGSHEAGIVWSQSHADFHTEDTTTSGYLKGRPLALAAGVGTLTLPATLGLHPVAESRIVLVDARDTDPAEQVLLDRTEVRRSGVVELDVTALPDGALYVHIDVDVCDPSNVPDLLYPHRGAARRQNWWLRSSASSRRVASPPWVSPPPGTTTAARQRPP